MDNHWTVTDKGVGLRLQQFIHDKFDGSVSAKQIKRCIENNACEVNGEKERFSSRRLLLGDTVSFDSRSMKRGVSQPISFDASRVIYEDSHLLIYNKPPGIPSDEGGLFQVLRKKYPDLLMVHRLDKHTSGAIIFAKSESVRRAFVELFREQQVKKEYWAIVDGLPNKSSGTINQPMGKINEYEGQSLWGLVSKKNGGVEAITRWKLVKRGRDAGLLTCIPLTGRTHQIRVHCNSMGHPLLGDKQYGKSFRCSYYAGRHLLHALKLSFPHPIVERIVVVEAPIPEDFRSAMNELFDDGEF